MLSRWLLVALPMAAWAQTPAPAAPAQSAAAESAPAQPAPVQSAPVPAAPPQTGDAIQAGMAAALAQQRASVAKQVSAVIGRTPTPAASFFTVPWVESPVVFNLPACDPVPSAQLDSLIENSSKQENVKPDLVRAVIQQESGGRPCAVSWKGAQGLMQLMPATADQFGVKDPFDPKQNVEAGTRLLKQLLEKYRGHISLALAAYNAGPERVDKDGGVPAIPETKNYVTDIMSKLPAK